MNHINCNFNFRVPGCVNDRDSIDLQISIGSILNVDIVKRVLIIEEPRISTNRSLRQLS